MYNKHQMRDERCDVFKQKRDKSLAYCGAQHLDRKETQQMQGSHLIESCKKYLQAAIEELIQRLSPKEQDELKICNIAKAGRKLAEKAYAKKIKAAWEKKQRNKIAKGKNECNLKQMRLKAQKR